MTAAPPGKPHIQQLHDLASSSALRNLDGLLDGFNIFDAIGMAHQEIRHSTFLAFLLSPNASHGLRDLILKAVLREAGLEASWLEEVDLCDTEVMREWNNIDVLAYNPSNKLVLVIENKVFTGEHDDQLGRYHKFVQNSYPDCAVHSLYLTPDGAAASHAAFRSISYSQLCRVLEATACAPTTPLHPIVRETIKHYIRAVRKHIVEDQEVKDLCYEIYRQHRSAIDTLMRNIPIMDVQLRERAKLLIQETEGLIFTNDWEQEKNPSTGVHEYAIIFTPASWRVMHDQSLLNYTRPDKWVRSGQVIYFKLSITQSCMQFEIEIRQASDDERRRLRDTALENSPPCFWKPLNPLRHKIFIVYQAVILSEAQMKTESIDDRLVRLDDWRTQFVSTDMQIIEKIFVEGLQPPARIGAAHSADPAPLA